MRAAVIAPGLYACGPISPTGVTSAAVPVMKHSLNVAEFVGHDAPLDDFDPAAAREIDDGRAGDAREEAVGDRRMDRSVLDEKDVGAGAFGHSALPVHISASA